MYLGSLQPFFSGEWGKGEGRGGGWGGQSVTCKRQFLNKSKSTKPLQHALQKNKIPPKMFQTKTWKQYHSLITQRLCREYNKPTQGRRDGNFRHSDKQIAGRKFQTNLPRLTRQLRGPWRVRRRWWLARSPRNWPESDERAKNARGVC